ncbi:metal-dependent hydrolase [Alkalihalobacillus sp. MEB130]|uniref:metal-dependent hydrolase n=1 Tax=Alkalihalobacillus sp. MEB130 TaxID=2976704 RepID=UPI0028DE7B27|nr:metal-dependent hydrolase [Alkalihalobacillus sp. MEB130]MDT8861638.1 metal-dependent hydrolase [Alkalihalobacillus sp. MEB130]
MDTITHTLFGLTTYGAINKDTMDKQTKKALLFSAIVGSQIPDIDVVANMTETGRIMEQMWHRGLTHSFFLAPFWAALIYGVAYLIWKRKDSIIFYLALVNVFIHNSTDSLNAWGTGVFEPISQERVTFGVLSIVDFLIWGIILFGFLISRWKKHLTRYKVWRYVWIAILLHISVQCIQGFLIYSEAKEEYEEVALSASFIPGHFTVIGKNNHLVTLSNATVWGGRHRYETLVSNEDADLEPLFQLNPKAEVLMEWSPFVVIVKDHEKLGVFDPRFYRNGSSFLFEYIKNER